MNDTLKNLRKQVYEIVIYSQGSFTIKELYQLPLYQIQEILDSFKEKQEKEKQMLDQAKGKKTF
jgi:Neuraminidase (sialidase)